MACSMHLVLFLTILLSLPETPDSAPAHRGRGGWTLNSAGYFLGPVLHLSSKANQGRKTDSALEILDLWKAIDGLPYSRSPRMTKRSMGETSVKSRIGDLRILDKNVPEEEATLNS